MGKVTGFIEWSRKNMTPRPVEERVNDYKEVYRPGDIEIVRQQAGRCMDCGIPFCMQGCPLGNLIPDWNDLAYRDHWREVFQRLDATNNFPEFTGRLCPAPCEAACVLEISGEPVTIEQSEKEIIERAFAEGWVEPRPPEGHTGQSVAVVGSGPAGLAAAQQLNRAGHNVVVYEASDRIGGMLRYGIPDFKMEKWVIDRRLEILEAEGVEFRTGEDIGKTTPWNQLTERHDAVLIAVGARVARDLDVPGRDLPGVVFAMDYLEQQNRVVAGETIDPAVHISARGKRVVILGGGDTGSDCFGTAIRQGASDVTQIELFPEPPKIRAAGNPWPKWPLIFRTSSSQQEGGSRAFGIQTVELSGERGRLEALKVIRVEIDGGRPIPVPGSEHSIPCDLLILAIGFTSPVTDTLCQQLGVELDARRNVRVDDQFRTSVPGVFAAGDASRGASLIVWAISDGREAARAIDCHLRASETALLPTRGRNEPF